MDAQLLTERTRLGAEFYRAELWLQVLCKGLGHQLADKETCYPPRIEPLLDLMRPHLSAAIQAFSRAQAAWQEAEDRVCKAASAERGGGST